MEMIIDMVFNKSRKGERTNNNYTVLPVITIVALVVDYTVMSDKGLCSPAETKSNL